MNKTTFIATAVALAIHGAALAENAVDQQQEGTGNFALVEQREGGGNSVLQYQLGDDHASRIYQAGNGLSASTSQSGIGQLVEINQTGVDSEAITTQAGQGNRVSVFQANTWGPNIVAVEQDGVANQASVYQLGPRSGWVDILQLGEANNLLVEQSGSVNSLQAMQEGVGHYGEIQQTYASFASLTQRGSNGYALIRQDSPSGTYGNATVAQDGNDNWMSVEQSAGDMGASLSLSQTGDANSARIDQDGNSSHINFAQTGTANDLVIDQIGSALTAFGSSIGTGNQVSVNQQGWDSSASVEQVGDANLASIDQNGGLQAFQSATISQIGAFNEATIAQTSLAFDGGNAATIRQVGSANVASIHQ